MPLVMMLDILGFNAHTFRYYILRAELTYSAIRSVCPVPILKFSHLSTLTPSTNGVNWEKENSFQLSLLSALSHLSFSLLPWQSWSKP
jgi:hypothetical protein